MIINKIKSLKYVQSPIIFAIDMVLSLFSSLIAYISLMWVMGENFRPDAILNLSISSFVWSTLLILSFRLSKDIIRYLSLTSILKITTLTFLKSIILYGFIATTFEGRLHVFAFIALLDFLISTFLLVIIRVGMIGAYRSIIKSSKDKQKRTFFYGTTELNPNLVQQINGDIHSQYRIVGFLSTNPDIIGHFIGGERIYKAQQSQEELKSLFTKRNIRSVIFSNYERFLQEKDGVVEFCMNNKINMLAAGKIRNTTEIKEGQQALVQNIQIEDILSRKEIVVNNDLIKEELSNDTILVTGAAGSIGSEIARQLSTLGVKQLILLDFAETPMHDLKLGFAENFKGTNIVFKIGDVRSLQRVEGILTNFKPSIIFHAAAYKHVPMMEDNPCESILANVMGTRNLANLAQKHGVRKFIMISTDKAVNPTNIMGASKRIAEMYIQSLNEKGKTEFITTRFGNVLGSNGSVIPYFKKQISRGGPVTVTHPDIIRYFMTIPEACRLVLQAATMGHAGQILVFDMGQPEKIVHLAERMIKLAGLEPYKDIDIIFTGLRPGEKLYEELLADKEDTLPSEHEKIRLAKSIKQDKEKLTADINELIDIAHSRATTQLIAQIKHIVPEYTYTANN